MPMFGFGRRRYYGGGGCLGGLLGILMAPLILLMVAILLITTTVGTAFSNVASGGFIGYDEEVFQAYANSEYEAAFGGNAEAYEDNLLIVFLVNEERDGYDCIAWIGDNVRTEIYLMFGDEQTEFGQAVIKSINVTDYKYSLDRNLATVMDLMGDEIEKVLEENRFSSSFNEENKHNTSPKSHLINKTELELTAATVNAALEDFTAATGIPVVIVVEDGEDVFGRTLPMSSILIVVMCVVLVIVAIVWIIRSSRKYKKDGPQGGSNAGGNGSGGYNGGTGNGYQGGYQENP